MRAPSESKRPGFRLPKLHEDRLLVALSFGVASVCALVLAFDKEPKRVSGEAGAEVATLGYASSDVRRRASGSLVWEELETEDPLFEDDAVFVSERGEATLSFDDGSKLEVSENSLVLVKRPSDDSPRVSLLQGTVEGRGGRAGMEIESELAVASLADRSEAKVAVLAKGQTRIEVQEGTIEVASQGKTHRAEKDRALEVRGQGKVTEKPIGPVKLSLPARHTRLFFRDRVPAVELRWSGARGEHTLQVALDERFERLAAMVPAESGRFDFQSPEAGSFFWRVVSPDGRPASETRRFSVVEDAPPRPSSPAPNEVVDGRDERPVQFAWTPVRGVRRYRVEVADDPAFNVVLAHGEVESSTLRLSRAFTEGTYYWRVRSADELRGESRYSTPVAFRLITSPLPAAPRLQKPELELNLAPGR